MNSKDQFIRIVYETIKRNPDWLESTIRAITEGTTTALDEQKELRCRAEAALVMAYSNKKLTPEQDAACKKVIVNSWFVGGTDYAKKLRGEA